MMQEIIGEVLGGLYKPERILTERIEQIKENEFKISFNFPLYDRTIKPLEHVSMLQIHEAILEGLYCSIGQVIKDGNMGIPISFSSFLKEISNAIYFRENFSFRRMLKANESEELIFRITDKGKKKLRKSFYFVIVQIDGFVRGEVECLLSV